MSYSHRHAKSKNEWFRLDVPHRLRALVGKTSWKCSLGTIDPYFAAIKRAELTAFYHAEIVRLDGVLKNAVQRESTELVDEGLGVLAARKGSLDNVVYAMLLALSMRVRNSWGKEHAWRAAQHLGAPPIMTIDDFSDADEEAPLAGFEAQNERNAIAAVQDSFAAGSGPYMLVLQQFVNRLLIRRQWDAVQLELMIILDGVGTQLRLGTPRYDTAAEHLLRRLSEHRFAAVSTEVREGLALVAADRPRENDANIEPAGGISTNGGAPASSGAKRLSDGLSTWSKLAAPKPQSVNEAARAVARFVNIFGDLPVLSITKNHILEYRDLLAEMPANLNMEKIKRDGASLRKIIQAASSGEDEYRTLAPGSLKKDIGALQAILSTLEDESWIPANVAAGVRVQGYSKTRKGQKNPRLPFRPNMMQALFESPLFTGCAGRKLADRSKPGPHVFQDELYWCFLFAAASGPRVEEIGQIALTDIEEIDLGKAYGLDVTGTCTVAYLTGTGEDQSTKNDASERAVVIHPRLIEIGFSKYVEGRRKSGATRLFDLTADDAGKWTKELSRSLNRYIDRTVTEDPRYTFHSLRHEWKDRAEESGIEEKMSDRITGHAPATVGRRYGVGASVRKQFVEIQKLNLNFIDWDRLKKAAG
ncbi:site-specific integrase [Sphingomonas sp. LM7]|uniref:site-specific integrase n=1 Tax=Sphingomonas sp. LM7 TaxID=1938607 RepID=UPI0012372166|nr:site-specific integrase [Sphingomonas sp. LM7]